MTQGPTRAELLEECKAAGLKATGWKKEKMAAELAKLQAPVAPELPADEQATSEAPADENQETGSSAGAVSRRRCGWCSGAPAWGRAHLTCRERGDRGLLKCSCECRDDDWVRPEIPEGAQLSKFNRIDREARGLPWEPLPGERLADAKKLAGGGEADGGPRNAGDPADAGSPGLAGLVGPAV